MTSLATPLRALLPAHKSAPAPPSRAGQRRSDDRGKLVHADIGGAIALAGRTNAVQQRAKVFRRSLILADVLSAGMALALSVQILGDDRLRMTTLAAFPLVVV